MFCLCNKRNNFKVKAQLLFIWGVINTAHFSYPANNLGESDPFLASVGSVAHWAIFLLNLMKIVSEEK